MQGKQTSAISSNDDSRHPIHNFKAGDRCYAFCFGPKQTKDPRWIPAVIIQPTGTRSVQVRTVLQGNVWRPHVNQLRARDPLTEDDKLGEDYTLDNDIASNSKQNNNAPESSTQESSVQESTNTLPHQLFKTLLIHDDRRGSESKELSIFVL